MDTTLPETQACRRLEFEQDEEDPSIDGERMEPLHSKIPKEVIPKIGMEFETENEAYEFYNAYALMIGFSVRRSTTHAPNGIFIDRLFVCSCEGKRGQDKRDDVYKSHRPETRFGCLARMKISCRYTEKIQVVKFFPKHNHYLASPRKAHLFRSHRKISASQALQVDMADSSGIAPKNAFELMAREAGGRENLGFAHVDYKNYLRTKRSLEMKSGDTGGVLEYLQNNKIEDPSFFYAIQVDEDDLITNVFWADAIMIADYEDFGDVICFDTTYRKHKDGRPIALFVGVNHHKQTTIFGAALLYDETAESFIWLFDTFSKAMGGKTPKTMLTDQDAAMSKALTLQWPKTRHRLCIWHIFQNAAMHLKSVFERYKDFSRDFSNCIYDYEDEEEFLDAWSKMLDKYELQDNDWLKRMFNIREKWALVYGRDMFCADMTTTQRSESINNLIKHYVSYKHDLRRFFEHFQRLLNDRRYDEMVADFKASQSRIVLAFPVAILKNAASVYTPKVYLLFQEELCKSYDCHLEFCGEMEALMKYEITPHGKQHTYIVYFDDTQKSVTCNCRKFEFAGLLCRHILKVFSFRDVIEVPSKYILKRWSKSAKRKSNEGVVVDVDPKTAVGMRYKDLCRISTRLFTRAAENVDEYSNVREILLNSLRELDLSSNERPVQSSSQNCKIAETDAGGDMLGEKNEKVKKAGEYKLKPKARGRSSKRLVGALEKNKNKSKNRKSKHAATPESSIAKENQAVFDGNASQQLVGSALQHPTGFINPFYPSTYNFPTPSEHERGNMNMNSVHVQPNHHFQPSNMALLSSIGFPQVYPQ